MSFFNPIRSQFRRLTELMNGMHCAELSAAASAMRVREAQVQNSLDIMTKRGYFGSDRPYIDRGIPAVVQDKRYQRFAELYSSAARLHWDLGRMRNVCIFTPEEKSHVRAQDFIREVVGSAFSENGGAGSVIRQKGSSFLRDLMNPEQSMPDQSAQTCATTLIENCKCLLSWLQSHPEDPTDPDVLVFVRSLDRRVQTYINCYPSAGLPDANQRREAERILKVLQSDVVPAFNQLIDRLYRRGMDPEPAAPMTPADELREQARQLMTLSGQMTAKHMRASVSRLAGLLNEIADQLSLTPKESAASCLRSLNNIYLPMTQELLMKYMRYERSIDPGPDVVRAMRNTENVLDEDLPKALKQLLKDMRSDSAIDMEAQASALRTKMRIDGMIN